MVTADRYNSIGQSHYLLTAIVFCSPYQLWGTSHAADKPTTLNFRDPPPLFMDITIATEHI